MSPVKIVAGVINVAAAAYIVYAYTSKVYEFGIAEGERRCSAASNESAEDGDADANSSSFRVIDGRLYKRVINV